MDENDSQRRVLIMAPVGHDAPAMSDLLEKKGYPTRQCREIPELCRLFTKGAGALLLTEEALETPQADDLFSALQHQPPWSEIPLIILTSDGQSQPARFLDLASNAAGGVTLLERPLQALTLLRSVEVALRSRDRQYHTRDLLNAKALLATIVETSEDAIISKDLNGIITSWNQAATRLFGYTDKEAVGQSITILIPPERIGEEETILSRIRRGESVEHFETVRRRKNGSLLDISLTISPVRTSDGRIIGASKIARDITQRKLAEQALREAQAELQERAAELESDVLARTAELRSTNDYLESFVYSIAHDLRSPLRAVSGYSQMLLDDYAPSMNEAGSDLLRRIQRSSEFMDRLLLDLLAYGKVARAHVDLSPVESRRAWASAVFQCAGQIEKTNASVSAVAPLPLVLGHEPTLAQCFANLLNNALKFVAPGVRPRVRCWAEDRGDRARFWIEDNGIGVPPDQHERIFRVFERLDPSSHGGTGIGLSIVRKGVERMNGDSGLESKPGVGSRFWIELRKAG